MTAPTIEKPPENLADDEWYQEDDPPGDGDAAGQEAPYGWMTDPETGEVRPKKAPGRPKRPATAEELAGAPPLAREPDRPPATGKRRKPKPPAGPPEPEMPEAGFIAHGVNRLYRRAGKWIRIVDDDIGEAVIYCTRPDDPDDISVGQAWEELCRANPRIRRFVLNALAGGAWTDLAMAHTPIAMAIFMKPAIQRMIPWRRVVESVGEPEPETGEGDLPGGMTADDVDEMGDLVSAQARRMAEKAARAAGIEVDDAAMAEAMAMADQMMRGGRGLTPQYEGHDLPPDEASLPAGLRRSQPKRSTRAQRAGR